MARLWIIEGQEGAGKTTLAKRIQSITKGAYIKHECAGVNIAHKDWRDDMLVAYVIGQLGAQRDIVLDRSIVSGVAYEPYATKETFIQIFDAWLELLEDAFDRADISFILLGANRRERAFRHEAPLNDAPALDVYARFVGKLFAPIQFSFFDTAECSVEEMMAALDL